MHDVIEVRAVFADGSQHERFWKLGEVTPQGLIDAADDRPEWMLEPRRSWPRPQDPIIYSFLVTEGREDEAREWMDAL